MAMVKKLKSVTNRANLAKGRWHYDSIAKGVALGYYRGPKAGRDGTWCVRHRAPKGTGGAYYTQTNLASADDLTDSDGVKWLSYGEAVEAALAKAREAMAAPDLPLTIGEACRAYMQHRKARGTGRPRDEETGLAKYLGPLADKRVAALRGTGAYAVLEAFAKQTPRGICRSLRAALAMTDADIRPDAVVLSALRHHRPTKHREEIEAVMTDAERDAKIAKARRYDRQYGLLTDVLASTGCRPSQVVRCRVGDLRASEGVLVVPPSNKGKKPKRPKPVQRLPLDPALMRELVAFAAGKPNDALLFSLPLLKRGGPRKWTDTGLRRGWTKHDWHRAAEEAGIDDRWRTYDLRHARIVALITAHVPLGAIANKLDTSVAEIMRTYARWLGTTTDDLFRAALPKRRKLTVVA